MQFLLWAIRIISWIVPRRIRGDWVMEWEAELRAREMLLAEWRRLDRRSKLDLLRRVAGSFRDALLLQPKRLEEEVFQDLRFGARMLRKNPVSTAVAVLTLALGIGANTAIFSVINSVLLNPLPFKNSERLVWFWGVQPMLPQTSLAPADFLDYQARNHSFEEMAAFRNMSFTRTGAGTPERINGRIVSANYFSMLGVGTTLGRIFTPDDGRAGTARVAILDHSFWQTRFGGDQNVLGKTLTLNDELTTVIGVASPKFHETDVDIWVNPRQIVPDMVTTSRADLLSSRETTYLRVLGRLKPGVTLSQAQTDIDQINQRLQNEHPATNAARSVHLVSLHERVVGDVRKTMVLLFAAVGVVLLIACANVSNLAIVRAISRSKETAIRLALGAGRARLVRQLLTESVLLAFLGGLCGWLIAMWGVNSLIALNPAGIPRLSEVRLDYSVLGFTLAISMLTGLVFGLAPVFAALKVDLNQSLKEGGRSASTDSGRRRLRGALVTAQMALALVVLVSAGLLLKSFAVLQTVKPGFDPAQLTTMLVWLSDEKYVEGEKRVAFMKELHRRLEVLPGVQGAAIANDLPIRGNDASDVPIIEGRPLPSSKDRIMVGIHGVHPNYFRAMGVPLLQGREIVERDDTKAPLVSVVNETAARILWPGENVVGKRLKFGENTTQWIEVVGVAGDIKHDGLEAQAGPHVYLSQFQTTWPVLQVAMRSSLDPAVVAAAVRREVEGIDPAQPVTQVATMNEMISASLGARRFTLLLFSLFAVLALLLTVIGIYGVVAHTVAQRTQEIGVRMALGAQKRNVIGLVVKQGMAFAVPGLAIGLAVSFAITRLMKSLLFEVGAADPSTFAIVTGLLAAAALAACYLPARRATKIDPIIALRGE
jgi:predicted permease